MTALDWKLAAQSAEVNGGTFDSVLPLTGFAAIVINSLGLWMLLAPEYKHGERPFLPIPKKLLVTIPLSALQLYIICYVWIKYFADYFRVWMHLVPMMFQSAALLTLLAMGFHGLHNQRRNDK